MLPYLLSVVVLCVMKASPSSLSQFFILSPRGDTIISKDYRGDSPVGAAEAFFRRATFWSGPGDGGSAPPVFRLGDVTYVWVKTGGLLFACNTRFNASPSTIVELLHRVVSRVDYHLKCTDHVSKKEFQSDSRLGETE